MFYVTAAGRSFGELALINADCVRNASIIADEITDLIVVNRDLYNRSLKVRLTYFLGNLERFQRNGTSRCKIYIFLR